MYNQQDLEMLTSGRVLFDISELPATVGHETCYLCGQEGHHQIATFLLVRNFEHADIVVTEYSVVGGRTYIHFCTDHARLQNYSAVFKWDDNKVMSVRPYVGYMANDPSENSEAGAWADQWEEYANMLESVHNIPKAFICTWDQLSDESKEAYKVMALKEQEEQSK